jgi:putative flippase GtrA
MRGLFLVRRAALDLDTFNPIGFKILLEIAVRQAPLKVLEVPYTFAERNAGESKASLREGLKFARHLMRLKTSVSTGWLRMGGVAAVGATGIAVNTAALWFFREYAGVALALAALLATQCSTAWNFALIDRLVYRRRRQGHWARRLVTFGLLNNLVLLLRLPLMSFFIAQLAMDYRVANIATLVLAFVARFAVVDRAIYRGDSHMTIAPAPTSVPTVRKPQWLDHQYDIPGLVRVCSQVQLPELEHFRVPARPGPHDIEIRVGEVGGPMRAHSRVSAKDGVTVYEEHLGKRGSSFRVEMGTPLHVTVGPLLAKSPHVVYTNIVEALLRFSAVTKGKILLHSACLDIDGVGVMLSARTDTGKTGTILRLLREQHASFLSDDMTIVDTDGVARTFPKPLTISQHTLRAVQADDLTPQEWRRLRVQSRLHSKEGRGIGMWLAKSNLPIMAMNAVTQRIIPPPKYTAGRLVPCTTTESVKVRDLFIIQRSEPMLEDIALEDAVTELLENTDDAYGFPPFATFAPTIVMDGMGWDELRAREEQILRQALMSGIRVRRLGSDCFDWADRIPQLLAERTAEMDHATVIGAAG